MFSKKEFKGFYKAALEFADIRGVRIDPVYKNELEEMKAIYDKSHNDKEFTRLMTKSGYGKIE